MAKKKTTKKKTTKKKTTKKFVWCQQWEESERGWGTHPDGYSLHLTEKQAERYAENFLNDQHEYFKKTGVNEVPDEYDRTAGEPYQVKVTQKVFDEVTEACKSRKRPGLRCSGSAPAGGSGGTWRKI